MADVANFDGLIDRLEDLAEQAEDLARTINACMDEWPDAPGQVTNAARNAEEVAAGLRRAIVRIGHLASRAQAHEELRARQAEERKYDAHTKAMAERMGITPDEFLELQETRRRQMRGAPGTVTYAPDHRVIR